MSKAYRARLRAHLALCRRELALNGVLDEQERNLSSSVVRRSTISKPAPLVD